MAETKDELKAQMNVLRKKMYKLEDAENKKRTASVVGKYFKYPRNCYSCPEKESDYWPVYFWAQKPSGSGIHGLSFETDKYGDIRIRFSEYHINTLRGYVEIKPREFWRAWAMIQKQVAALTQP